MADSRQRETAGTRWSSRSVGTRWQHGFFYLLIRLGGRALAYLFLYVLILYYMLLRPDQRKKSEYYLRRRFPGSSPWRLGVHSYRMSLELGKVLIDRAALGILGGRFLDISVQGKEQLLGLVGEGRGLILMTAHVGCWQVAMSALQFLRTRVNLLMQREQGDIDRHFFEHGGSDSPFHIIDPRGYLGGTLEMLGVLKNGEVLSVMGDRMLGSDRSAVSVSFLGGEIAVPYSAYKIASATGAPVAVLLSHKSGFSSYRMDVAGVIRVPPGLGRKPEAYRSHAQVFAAMLEDYTWKNPYQFFNFYDMWNNDNKE